MVPMWVKVSELTEEEKLKYEEVEKIKIEERLAWKNAMEERRASEVDAKEDADENDMNDGSSDEDDDRNETNNAKAGGVQDESVVENPSADISMSVEETSIQNENDAMNAKEVAIEELTALNQTSEDTAEPPYAQVGESSAVENSMKSDVVTTNQSNNQKEEDCAQIEDDAQSEPLLKKQRLNEAADAQELAE